MARSRYYYSDMISNFLVKAKDTIIGELSVASQHDINDETMTTWLEEIGVMKGNLMPYCDHGSAYRVLLTGLKTRHNYRCTKWRQQCTPQT